MSNEDRPQWTHNIALCWGWLLMELEAEVEETLRVMGKWDKKNAKMRREYERLKSIFGD